VLRILSGYTRRPIWYSVDLQRCLILVIAHPCRRSRTTRQTLEDRRLSRRCDPTSSCVAEPLECTLAHVISLIPFYLAAGS
jgi:hypothetical protein